jgi:hypothetical protein
MSRVIQVNDTDYKVKVRYNGQEDSTGTITLDVGNTPGKVVVTGDLTVYGQTTTVRSTQVTMTDNIIVVNNQLGIDNQPYGNGILSPTREAGVQIGRGTFDSAQILFSENLWWYDNQSRTDKQGAFVFKLSNTLLNGIRTNSITTNDKDQNLNLLGPSPSPSESGTGTSVISVHGVPDYDQRIKNKLDIDQNQVAWEESIPNVKWVNGAIADFFNVTPPTFIQRGDSRLQIFDTQVSDVATKLELSLNGVVNATFNTTNFRVQNLNIANGTIETTSPGLDLVLRSSSSGSVTIDDTLKMVLVSQDPDQENGTVKIYTKSETYGGTGIYFVNNETTRDELVSRRKALAYSYIF